MPNRLKELLPLLALVGLVVAVFGQTVGFEFINYDDDRIIYEHPVVTQGLTLHGIVWAFTHPHHYLYMPITSISHMADVSAWGLWPGGHHLGSVLLHAANACLLYLALVALTGQRGASLFVAAVFAVHPLRAGSVAWLASRKDLVCAFFFFFMLLHYAHYARNPRAWGRYVGVVVCFALGVLAKPVLVTAPFVLLLLDCWPLNRISLDALRTRAGWHAGARLVWEKAPLFAVAVTVSAASLWAQRMDGGSMAVDVPPIAERVADALLNYVRYIGHTLYPVNVAIHYPLSTRLAPADPTIWATCAFLFLAIMSTLFLLLRRSGYLLIGWLWFLGMLVPNIGLVRYDHAPFAARHSYLPSIGFYILIAFAVAELVQRKPVLARPVQLAAATLVVLLTCLGIWQTGYWRNTESVFARTAEVTLSNDVAHKVLGEIRLDRGETDAALRHFEKAVDIEPNNSDGLFRLGRARVVAGKYAEAIAPLQALAEGSPNDADAQALLGRALVESGAYASARKPLEQALRLNPGLAGAWLDYGCVCHQAGETATARKAWGQARVLLENHAADRAEAAKLLTRRNYPEGAALFAE